MSSGSAIAHAIRVNHHLTCCPQTAMVWQLAAQSHLRMTARYLMAVPRLSSPNEKTVLPVGNLATSFKKSVSSATLLAGEVPVAPRSNTCRIIRQQQPLGVCSAQEATMPFQNMHSKHTITRPAILSPTYVLHSTRHLLVWMSSHSGCT